MNKQANVSQLFQWLGELYCENRLLRNRIAILEKALEEMKTWQADKEENEPDA